MPMGSNFGDLDNDGFPDFYLGTGYPNYEALMPNLMYHNQRGKAFANVTTAGGFGHLQKGHAVVFCDLDNDGDQDVFEQVGGAYPGDGFVDVMFKNPGFGNPRGSYAVLEVRTSEVPFTLEDGQIIATILYEKLNKIPKVTYGSEINSNYQNQNLALSKHFNVIG